MISEKGEKLIGIGKLNRNRIIMELLKSPLTFTALKGKVKLSAKTLTEHLNNLLNEGLVKREIQGKYIVYIVTRPQTVLNMRKDFSNELLSLIGVYDVCLNTKTSKLFIEFAKALQESINNHELEAKTDKVFQRKINVPKGKIAEWNLGKPYEKPKLEKLRKRGRPER